MTERTVCIPTLGLEPGIRLAQAVRRADGGLLLAAGTELDVEQVRQLVQRGIEFVHVAREETRDAARIEHDVATAVARVVHLFRGKGTASRDELAAAIVDYRRQEAS